MYARPLLLRLLAACALSGAAAPSAASAAAYNPGTPYAIHSMLYLNSPYVFKQEMFAAAAVAGASEIRVDVALGNVYQWMQPDDWSGVDQYMHLSERYHIRVLADLPASNPWWIVDCVTQTNNMSGCGIDTRLSDYGSMVAQLAAHTRGVINDFEIINEPDNGQWYIGTPQQYAGMLATAYEAIHAANPQARVALGAMMSLGHQVWLSQVFAAPGYNAAHKFDIANVHIRGPESSLAGQTRVWHGFFARYGDANKPLWITETGYPSDPAYQFDSHYRGDNAATGQTEQAAYLTKGLPAMIDAGAAKVFVTERDNLGGQFASEGLLGGQVTDSDQSDPHPLPKPSYTAYSKLAQVALATANEGARANAAEKKAARANKRAGSQRG